MPSIVDHGDPQKRRLIPIADAEKFTKSWRPTNIGKPVPKGFTTFEQLSRDTGKTVNTLKHHYKQGKLIAKRETENPRSRLLIREEEAGRFKQIEQKPGRMPASGRKIKTKTETKGRENKPREKVQTKRKPEETKEEIRGYLAEEAEIERGIREVDADLERIRREDKLNKLREAHRRVRQQRMGKSETEYLREEQRITNGEEKEEINGIRMRPKFDKLLRGVSDGKREEVVNEVKDLSGFDLLQKVRAEGVPTHYDQYRVMGFTPKQALVLAILLKGKR
ncbi:MAG: hypothetical protein ABID38_03220 [Candidatus Diapherotrites archaeon]